MHWFPATLDRRSISIEVGVAFGQDVDRGPVILAVLVGQDAEPSAEDPHTSGGEGEQAALSAWLALGCFVVAFAWLKKPNIPEPFSPRISHCLMEDVKSPH